LHEQRGAGGAEARMNAAEGGWEGVAQGH
jgi:hypothetical protein